MAWFHFHSYGFIFERNQMKPFETVSILSTVANTKSESLPDGRDSDFFAPVALPRKERGTPCISQRGIVQGVPVCRTPAGHRIFPLLQPQRIRREKLMGGNHGAGRHKGGGTATAAGHADPLRRDLRLVAILAVAGVAIGRRITRLGGILRQIVGGTLLSVGATAVQLPLRLQLPDDIQHDLAHLRVAEVALVTVQCREIRNAVLLQHIQQLQLGARQLRLDPVDFPGKADIHVRIRARQSEQIVREENRIAQGKGVRLGAKQAGHRQPDSAVRGALPLPHDLHLALSAGAFQFDHVGRQSEQPHGTHHAGATEGAAVRNGGVFFFQNHTGKSILSAKGRPGTRSVRRTAQWLPRLSYAVRRRQVRNRRKQEGGSGTPMRVPLPHSIANFCPTVPYAAVSLSAVSVPVTLSPSETASVAVSEAGSVAAEVPPVTVVAAPVVSAAVACS